MARTKTKKNSYQGGASLPHETAVLPYPSKEKIIGREIHQDFIASDDVVKYLESRTQIFEFEYFDCGHDRLQDFYSHALRGQ